VTTKNFSQLNITFAKPSGRSLLLLLSLILGSFTLITDWHHTNFFTHVNSLTLPLIICALLCGALGYVVVPILQRLKTGQIVQEDGPKTHLKKAGTPTMGGIFFVPIASILAMIWTGFNAQVIAVSLLTLSYCLIGLFDDWQVLKLKSNKGISPRMKLILQIIGATLFCLWTSLTQSADLTNINLPFNLIIPCGIFFWFLAVFVLVAESNATNITDGVDGLAGGTVAIASIGLAIIVAPTHPHLMIFCACIAGGSLGFILHNRNPATVFMGDTGSLALGGALGAVGILSGNLWALFILSGLFFVECLSVMAQVYYYKATKDENGIGKRLLKMAPIHHHIELSGWGETQIVGLFYLINTALVILALIFKT
jgi:phospho-N-acetylmuramoyl-pentapeptide-transferase